MTNDFEPEGNMLMLETPPPPGMAGELHIPEKVLEQYKPNYGRLIKKGPRASAEYDIGDVLCFQPWSAIVLTVNNQLVCLLPPEQVVGRIPSGHLSAE